MCVINSRALWPFVGVRDKSVVIKTQVMQTKWAGDDLLNVMVRLNVLLPSAKYRCTSVVRPPRLLGVSVVIVVIILYFVFLFVFFVFFVFSTIIVLTTPIRMRKLDDGGGGGGGGRQAVVLFARLTTT